MHGGDLYPVNVTLRNPCDSASTITYSIIPHDTVIARDWQRALIEILDQNLQLEKNFCWLGFPYTPRDQYFLCSELNHHVAVINRFSATGAWRRAGLDDYWIEETFSPQAVRFHDGLGDKSLRIKHGIMNRLHTHFERLQGLAWQLSDYYRAADAETRYSIRQLNYLCHELESKILTDRKLKINPHWIRPSQITTFPQAARYELTDQHRQEFLVNRYDREFGGVYLHWTQIGKTLIEVWRDEDAPDLQIGADATEILAGSGAQCEAITALRYYSGEFDVEWARDVVSGGDNPWHDAEQSRFRDWIEKSGLDWNDTNLCLGYIKLGQVDLERSFGSRDVESIWKLLGQHLDIYEIECAGHRARWDHDCTNQAYRHQQIQEPK